MAVMSAALSIVSQAAGVAGTVGDLLGLNTTNVTLGGFTFSGDLIEIPDKMRWGVKQHTARHCLPGGTVIIDAMGADWPPIAWRGIFDGPGATARAKSLATLCRAGAPLTLTWLDRIFLVVISSFTADDTTTGWVPYQITCEVAADADQFAGPPAPPSLGQQILSDINDALGFNVVDAAGQAAAVLAKVSAAASLAGAFTGGSSAFTTLAGAAATAGGVIGGAISLAEIALNGLGTVVSGASAATSWLTTAAAQAGNLAQATAASASIGRIQANLSLGGV
jgi:hypothetical protein